MYVSESQERCKGEEAHTIGPGLMDGSLLPELLCQVVEPLQPADFIQQPLLVALLSLLQMLPAIVDVLQGWERSALPQGSCLTLLHRSRLRESVNQWMNDWKDAIDKAVQAEGDCSGDTTLPLIKGLKHLLILEAWQTRNLDSWEV